MPASRPRIATIAAIVAFVIALSIFLFARTHILLALVGLVPLAAGISILRRRVWGAYGLALVELVQSTITPLALIGSIATPPAQLATSIGFGIAVSALFFFAGRSLAQAGAPRGWATPWIVVAFLFTVPFFFVQAYSIPTGAMEDTLLIGDRIVVRKFPRPTPGIGDVLVFRDPVTHKQVYVKRVVGIPGDHIRMSAGVVYRNGARLNEPYAIHKFNNIPGYGWNLPASPNALPPSSNFDGGRYMLTHNVINGEIVVPPGKYFVLGDNRDNSFDSRYFGLVDASAIIGNAVMIYDSAGPDRRERWSRIFKRVSAY